MGWDPTKVFGIFAAKISLIQALGGGEQLGVNGCRPDRTTDLVNRLADCIEGSLAAPQLIGTLRSTVTL
jgi:hypothetical protein